MSREKILYISDLDGTLLNSDKAISEYTKKVVNIVIANGGYFTIATARTAVSTVNILAGLNINIPIVLMNGVAIYDLHSDKYIKTEALSEPTANAIIEVLKEHNVNGFMYAISNDKLIAYYDNLNSKALQAFHDERVKYYNKSFEQVGSLLNKTMDNNIVYFTLMDHYETLYEVCNELNQLPNVDVILYRNIYTENLWYLEILSNNASKCNAVRFIRERFRFDNIIGFGDNLNDISLFKACDESYAVSNAVDELKEKATGIIADNNSDGVARFIAERVAGKEFINGY